MMTLETARTLKPGDRLTMTVATMGGDENDAERIHPEGAVAVVETVETLPLPQGFAVHVTIGEGSRAIRNTFDESDYAGGYPFAPAALQVYAGNDDAGLQWAEVCHSGDDDAAPLARFTGPDAESNAHAFAAANGRL